MGKLFSGVILSLCLASGLFAQLTSINGTVTDLTGAVVPNVVVTIVNTKTSVQRTATSDAQGRYTMAQVTPGTYQLTAKAPGFVDVVLNDVQLQVNQPATVAVIFAKVGSTTTTVEVLSAATQVNTTDATLGNAIGATAITELPFFARNITNLLAAQPGVTMFSSGGDSRTNANGAPADTRNGSVNGGKPDQSNITLVGVDVNNQTTR